jgi:hypothetical protein
MNKVWLGLALASLLAACDTSDGGASLGGEDPQQAQLPKIKVNLPPPPSFKKDTPPEMYPDSSYSVYGLRENMETTLNENVRVKGFVVEVYECPKCPRGAKCKECDKPHFWIADRANAPKDQALIVTDYPKKDPDTRKKTEFDVGSQYYVTGVFSKTSGTGFSSSDGLLIFSDAELTTTQAE